MHAYMASQGGWCRPAIWVVICSDPLCFPSLQSRASVYIIVLVQSRGRPCFDCVSSFYACLLAVGFITQRFIHQHTSFKNLFSRLAYFSRRPPRMMGVIAGQNVMRTWPSSVSRQLLLLLMALALMFLYLTFHCRQDFWCLSSQKKKLGWDGPHRVTLGTQNKFGTRVHLTNETIA